MKKLLLLLWLSFTCSTAFCQATIIKYLSGTDKDHTRQWDFYCTAGRKSGVWTKIAVPGNWELQGFGSYNYGHDKVKSNEQGLYKEVTVDKTSANTSVNDAERKNSDFWVFGGIFRPVYLEIVPETFIDRIAVNATADGLFKMDVFPQNIKGNELIEAQVQKLNGEKVGKAFTVKAAAAEGARQLTLWLPDNKAP